MNSPSQMNVFDVMTVRTLPLSALLQDLLKVEGCDLSIHYLGISH